MNILSESLFWRKLGPLHLGPRFDSLKFLGRLGIAFVLGTGIPLKVLTAGFQGPFVTVAGSAYLGPNTLLERRGSSCSAAWVSLLALLGFVAWSV